MAKKTFNVPKIHCSSCIMLLEGIEDELPGVERVHASLRAQQMEVTYDEAKVTVDDIINAAKQEGYEAIPVEEREHL